MTQYLPLGEFEWIEDVNNFDFNVPDDNEEGYFLEVDLDYPQKLHDMHSDLPFCPENKTPPGVKINKLLTTLDPKEKYVLHYRNLKQAVKNGLMLEMVLAFKQSDWLKPYIELNTELR